MNIAILGATGNFGRLFTAKLLANPNYQLTVISKSAGNIFEDSHRVTAKSIDATNLKELKNALKNQDIVYSAISGSDLPVIARNLVEINPKRLIFMGVVGIHNELAEGNGAEFNVDNEPKQIPNRNAVDTIEDSQLDYTILRPGFLRYGEEDDYIITSKGETPKGYFSTVESVEKIALEIIENPKLYSRENISITKDMS
ncbi:NAD(P)H-binding protein [Methanobrevibacter sp.]|uniref:NAD(P)H-binding protein n=1 Tax=Methanobrevibacter sp. TaxID=66852 RepID=UPI0026DF7900|nr:NAD(P)H-binding protein [Methanobrevibacter sp.]MDO5860377.1 NAD(P)H-binding protein [Methanobrevibacter sp.]